MPTYEVQSPDGTKYKVNAPDGATEQDAIAYVQKNFTESKPVEMPKQEAPSKGFGESLNSLPSQFGRQLGLTARYGLEGMGAIPAMLGGPLQAMGVKGAAGNAGTTVADAIGLPSPQGTMENVVGSAARIMAPAGLMTRGANALAQGANGIAKSSLEALAAKPVQQLISGAGSGSAGEYVKQTGGNEGAQFGASVVGGLLAPASVSTAASIPSKIANSSKKAVEFLAPGLSRPNVTNIDVLIQETLRPSGISIKDIPAGVLASIRNDVAEASKQGDLSGSALERLIAYRSLGATPLKGNLTLDPVQLTREKNLAKMGANTTDPQLGTLARRENQNNQILIDKLNEMGAGTADDRIAGASKVMEALKAKDSAAKANIDGLYANARGTEGRSANLDPAAFTQRASNLLDDALLGGKLDADVRGVLNKIAKGEMPLTVDVAEQLKTKIYGLQQGTNDRSAKTALGMVRQALEETPLLDGQGKQAIDAFNTARQANRSWMGVVDKTPALQAIRDGIEPDQFVQKFVIGSGDGASVMSLAQLKNLAKDSPQATTAIREQIMLHIKNSALSGAKDEFGSVSQSALNKVVSSIGERKLALFFSKDEIQTLKNVSKVASAEQFQPKGSAVNNSNTSGATVGTLLDSIGRSPLLGKIPFGSQLVGEPLRNISAGMNARQALNAPSALALPRPRQSLAPQVFVPGMFAVPQEEQRRGLLAP